MACCHSTGLKKYKFWTTVPVVGIQSCIETVELNRHCYRIQVSVHLESQQSSGKWFAALKQD